MRYVKFICDVCEGVELDECKPETADEEFSDAGWVRIGDRDYCDECKDNLLRNLSSKPLEKQE